jgi:hypothetical protein
MIKKEKIMVILILGVVLGFVVLYDTIGMSVVGFPKSDKEILKVLEEIKNNKPEEYEDNDFINSKIAPMYKSKIIDETLIYTFQKPYISKAIRGVTFGWYVEGLGSVPRWYKSHSEIDKLYNELKNK